MVEEERREEDVCLLARSAAGDSDAFATLFDRYGPLCVRRAYEVLRDRALADDAVQEAFLDLWRTAASFDARRASVRTWLCVLVHRRAVDLARREARRRRGDEAGLLSAVDPSSYTAEEALERQLERRSVQTAMLGLSDPQRRLLELAYYGGLTQSQLSARLGLPLGTVKSRMRDALARLALLLRAPERVPE